MKYNIIFSKNFKKKLNSFDWGYKEKIKKNFYLMSLWLFQELDIKELSPKWNNLYRLRVWKYRIIYEKQDLNLIILVLDIWSRWDIYK
ncbi:MAG: hypothetical protein ACD_49C00074G0031 [uncultured bacterium (gcode 4)]|uniref:Type II toxin-antitoxin system mRNA interferase toxin, RelE/StbE family n=1 Tax=uncultured bacterium (gcode 4) TaxID=1234023 RepID=K2BUL3_9BACT|nr:MAG: hypothetical protein ACD_49C00074G0031 [uncultured bacterium (gcode 4)]